MYLGLSIPAPSILELSQLLDGLFPHSTCLSYFIQAPPLGFKELKATYGLGDAEDIWIPEGFRTS